MEITSNDSYDSRGELVRWLREGGRRSFDLVLAILDGRGSWVLQKALGDSAQRGLEVGKGDETGINKGISKETLSLLLLLC